MATHDLVSLSLKLPFLGYAVTRDRRKTSCISEQALKPQSVDEQGAANNDSSTAGCCRNSRSEQSPQPERNFFTCLVSAKAECYMDPHGLLQEQIGDGVDFRISEDIAQ